MSNVINLNKVRKAKARTASEKLAAENRLRFGRSKDEKQRERNQTLEAARKLDGHKLEGPSAGKGAARVLIEPSDLPEKT